MISGRILLLVFLSFLMGAMVTMGVFLVSVLLYGFLHDPQAGASPRLFTTYVIGTWLFWIWFVITPRALPKTVGVWVNIAFPLVLGIIFLSEYPRVLEVGVFMSSSLVSYNALVKWGILAKNA